MITGALTGARRAADLARVAADGVDVLVVGGGITGTGVALDAATRGLSVALVERHDLAHRHQPLEPQARARRAALPRPGRRRPGLGERARARHPARSSPLRTWCARCRWSCRSTPRSTRRRRGWRWRPTASATYSPRPPAPAPQRFPARAGLGARRPLALRPRPARRRTCAAGCCRGTASSRTTPAWWSPSPARPRRSARGSCTRVRRRPAATPAAPTRARRAHRRVASRSAPARSSTRPASGPASWPSGPRCDRARARTWCCAPSSLAAAARGGHRAGAGRAQPVRAGAPPARRR